LLEATKTTFAANSFITISAYEVATIDNTEWLSIHLCDAKLEKDSHPTLCGNYYYIHHFLWHLCFDVEMFWWFW
jgi:hypothetical protein